jgi:hypothetical protein
MFDSTEKTRDFTTETQRAEILNLTLKMNFLTCKVEFS